MERNVAFYVAHDMNLLSLVGLKFKSSGLPTPQMVPFVAIENDSINGRFPFERERNQNFDRGGRRKKKLRQKKLIFDGHKKYIL
jgi:hypothetical protein